MQFAYEGIPYLNEEDERNFRKDLNNNALVNYLDRLLSYSDEDEIKHCWNTVAEWLQKKGQQTVLQLNVDKPLVQYLVHKELRKRFLNIWTSVSDENVIKYLNNKNNKHY